MEWQVPETPPFLIQQAVPIEPKRLPGVVECDLVEFQHRNWVGVSHGSIIVICLGDLMKEGLHK